MLLMVEIEKYHAASLKMPQVGPGARLREAKCLMEKVSEVPASCILLLFKLLKFCQPIVKVRAFSPDRGYSYSLRNRFAHGNLSVSIF